MNASWTNRVEVYVERLTELTTALDERLDEVRMLPLASRRLAVADGSEAAPIPIDPEQSPEVAEVAELVKRLEGFVAQREELLCAEDAPEVGLTLSEKLLGTHRIEDARLAMRCREASEQIQTTHHRAVSLFVCQFHLANFGSELLQILSGGPEGSTYGPGKPSRGHGGGLFNDAA